jgi:hypothetical protein
MVVVVVVCQNVKYFHFNLRTAAVKITLLARRDMASEYLVCTLTTASALYCNFNTLSSRSIRILVMESHDALLCLDEWRFRYLEDAHSALFGFLVLEPHDALLRSVGYRIAIWTTLTEQSASRVICSIRHGTERHAPSITRTEPRHDASQVANTSQEMCDELSP